jgi:DMSO/TMAO reductase YedYZ molybdopterin-dependent catalytic subunit
MKKSTKIALGVFIVLIIAVIPLYYYTRPEATQPSGTLQIRGKVGSPANLTFTQLEDYPTVTLQVSINGHQGDNGNYGYTGVTLKELLNQAQVENNATSVFIQASDGYGTTLTIQEALKDNVFVAYKKDGAALSLLSDGGEGPYRLVMGDDEYAQRWVRGVVAIEVS